MKDPFVKIETGSRIRQTLVTIEGNDVVFSNETDDRRIRVKMDGDRLEISGTDAIIFKPRASNVVDVWIEE